MIDKTFGHYQINYLIRRGGISKVHRAKDHKRDHDLEVKVLPELPAFDKYPKGE